MKKSASLRKARFGSRREEVVKLLQRGFVTVAELASHTGLTDNAIRSSSRTRTGWAVKTKRLAAGKSPPTSSLSVDFARAEIPGARIRDCAHGSAGCH